MRRPSYLSIYVWLVTHAQHGMVKMENGHWRRAKPEECRQVVFRGEKISLSPGQLTCGSHQITDETGVPPSTVRRILNTMIHEELIEQQTSNRCSLITLKRWEAEQTSEQQNEQQMGSKEAADGQQMGTKEEGKNKNNEEKGEIQEINATRYGKEDINEIIGLMEETFGLPVLDGSKKENRYAAHRLIEKMKKACDGSHVRAMECIRAALIAAKVDSFWGSGGKMTSVMVLEKHIVSILQKATTSSPMTQV